MKILCVGMMVCDTLLSPVPFDILSRDSVSINPPVLSCGGDALNVAVGLGKLGCEVSVLGRIGKDDRGSFLVRECEKYGVAVNHLIYDEKYPTASSFALIDETGERHFLSEKSIFHQLNGNDIPDKAIQEADIIYFGSVMSMSQMDTSGIYSLFHRAHQLGKITVMDAAVDSDSQEKNWMEFLKPVFRETDIFFPSFEEASYLTGKEESTEIAECFSEFPMKLFGIKMGSRGSYATDFQKGRFIQCPKGVSVIDTTGAGDSFLAGLLCGISKGWDKWKAVAFASCVASKNVEALGGTAGIPDFKEAYDFYKYWEERGIFK